MEFDDRWEEDNGDTFESIARSEFSVEAMTLFEAHAR